MEWEPVIGLEVHAQLSTKSKIFSGASATYGAEPNTQACAIDLGLPGVLPVLNQDAVKMAIKFGLAVDAEIPKRSVFARKNYFYPDLPKGYQISQYELPIVQKGHLKIVYGDGKSKLIGLTRAHLEEDAGKSMHEGLTHSSGIDLNRAGIPLLEIVSEPELRSAKEAVAYLKVLHTLVRYLKICDGNLQEGSFRCDVNVSVRPKGQSQFGTRAEIKNMNSFRFIEKAINYEIKRQIEILEQGGTIRQETRLFDEGQNITRSMRIKEEANDYRYFPDPDLLPVDITQEFIDSIRKTLPELSEEKYQRFKTQYQLNDDDARWLASDRDLANFFEAMLPSQQVSAKLAVNWMMGEFAHALNRENISIAQSPIQPAQLALLVRRIEDNTISGKIAKTVFQALWDGEGDVDEMIAARGLEKLSDTTTIEKIIKQVIADNPQQFQQYQQGTDKLFGFFVGQVMKATQGKADPRTLNEILKKCLETRMK